MFAPFPTSNVIAAPLLRVSSDDQRDRGTIDTQREEIERFCSRYGIRIYNYYADDGVSGTIPVGERPAGAHLLHDAEQALFNLLLLYSFDRLGRGDRAVLPAVWKLLDLGIDIRSILRPDIDLRTAHGWRDFIQEVNYSSYERAMFLQRSFDGTQRLVREGAWVGGIVPFGYRVDALRNDGFRGIHRRKAGKLTVATDPIPGLEPRLSEKDVVQMIYRLIVDERWSCHKIAVHLNALGILPVYARDGREVLRGKRKERTAGVWRAGRVRSLIVNPTYKGIHQYGKNSKKPDREIIEREVEAIVDVDTWERAQQVLRDNMLMAKHANHHKYLLRGLIKCTLCGLTYIGTSYPAYKGGFKGYYVCSGKHNHRKLLRPGGVKCPSKAINAETIEREVWADIEGFLRNPGDVLQQLGDRVDEGRREVARLRDLAAGYKPALASKELERTRILMLYRRGGISDAQVDEQLSAIQEEEDNLKAEINQRLEQANSIEAGQARLHSAEALLEQLNHRLDRAMTWERQRQLVEILVARIDVETVTNERGKKQAIVNVTYCFNTVLAMRTDRDFARLPA